jgi:hypothetical protein
LDGAGIVYADACVIVTGCGIDACAQGRDLAAIDDDDRAAKPIGHGLDAESRTEIARRLYGDVAAVLDGNGTAIVVRVGGDADRVVIDRIYVQVARVLDGDGAEVAVAAGADARSIIKLMMFS